MESPDEIGDFEGVIRVRIDPLLADKDALLKACYWFSGKFHLEMADAGDGSTEVYLKPKPSTTPKEIVSCSGEFLNAVLDFVLRGRIEAATASIRELVLAKAFAEAGVLEGSLEDMLVSNKESRQTSTNPFVILQDG